MRVDGQVYERLVQTGQQVQRNGCTGRLWTFGQFLADFKAFSSNAFAQQLILP